MKKNYNQKEIRTAIIYTRVSSKEQLEGYSLGSQEEVCRKFAASNGLTVLKVFIEKGESAKTANRTKLQEMMKFCALNKGRIGYLIVYKVNRLTRNNEDHYTLKIFFQNYGIKVRSATKPLNETAAGKFMEVVLAGIPSGLELYRT